MSLARTEKQVTWASANSKAVAAAGNETSDAVTISETAINGSLYIKADNSGTPADGDEVEVKILYCGGDTDADPDSTDEYETDGHAATVGVLDTYTDDPALLKVKVDVAAKSFKLYAENSASSNSITVSAQYVEQTAS